DFFEKQKLTGPNFIDWYRQLRLVLSTEDKEYYLEHPIPAAPVAQPGEQIPPEDLAAHAAWLLLGDYVMLQELKAMFSKQAEQELLQTRLGQPVGQNLYSESYLSLLNKDFYQLRAEFPLCTGMGKTVNELHAMLKLHEESLPKKDANPALHAIRAGRVQKNQKNKPHKAGRGGKGKGKNKMGYAHNNVPFAPKPKTLHTKKVITQQRTPSVTNVVKLGTGEGTKLKPGAFKSVRGRWYRAAVESIWNLHLELPSGLVIVLINFHYAPSNLSRVSKDNLVYFMAVPRDGIFEIDMSCSNTNDSSIRYGYVYLLKHKHEVFETFKVFQKEVENQLGKTIKSLRSDRGGEYMSQEFLDHLKEHGIIAHRTPPYTPQNNGVSERRNRTLLDMVRSMMR
ncbi:zinc finger, CCHC-type containing protein, partial [Tanacetum coccineum]